MEKFSELPWSVLFFYGSLRSGGAAAEMLCGCELLGVAHVPGALYDVGGEYPALVLNGSGEVEGEIWRCPLELLPRLDRYELVGEGLYRRVRVQAAGHDCWTYVAGPALAPYLTAEQRIASGRWPPDRS